MKILWEILCKDTVLLNNKVSIGMNFYKSRVLTVRLHSLLTFATFSFIFLIVKVQQISKKKNIQCNIIESEKKLMCINCSLTFCSHIWLSKVPQHVSFHQNLMLAHSRQNQQNDLALFSRDTQKKILVNIC